MKPYYQHNGITIYHGDCREVLPTIGKVDLVLTDPPYGIGFAAQPTDYQRLHGAKKMDWDNERPTPKLMEYILAKAEKQIVWGGNYFALPPSRCWLVWFKPDVPSSFSRVELAWTNLDALSKHMSHSISATNAERVGHPTQKPLAVISWCFSLAPAAKSVLDPFMGSGTTLVAAKQLGVQATGIELEEKYCEIAAKRLAQEYMQFDQPKVTTAEQTAFA